MQSNSVFNNKDNLVQVRPIIIIRNCGAVLGQGYVFCTMIKVLYAKCVHKLSHMKKWLSPCLAMENPQNKFYQKSKYMLHNYISYATIL